MEWGIAAVGNGRISELALDGASCILSVNIEFFLAYSFSPFRYQTNFFRCKQVGVCGRMWVNVEEVEEICS